jgi:DNA-binding Lrp family transcriptional regulator
MKSILQEIGFDELDRAILEELQANCRISNAELARKIHLSQPAVHNRIKRLEKKGVIQAYSAIVDRDVVGYDLLCFIHITLDTHAPEQMTAFEAAIVCLPEVLEFHRLTGDYDALLKVVLRNRKHLDRFITEALTPIDGIKRIQTSLVLDEVKCTTALPLKR